MVGIAGFEPATSRPPDERATRLRYTPTTQVGVSGWLSRCQYAIKVSLGNAYMLMSGLFTNGMAMDQEASSPVIVSRQMDDHWPWGRIIRAVNYVHPRQHITLTRRWVAPSHISRATDQYVVIAVVVDVACVGDRNARVSIWICPQEDDTIGATVLVNPQIVQID